MADWSLYITFEGLTLESLDLSQVLAVVKSLDESSRQAWLVKRPYETQWRRLDDMPEIYEHVSGQISRFQGQVLPKAVGESYAPNIETPLVIDWSDSDLRTLSTMKPHESTGSERRGARRFTQELTVRIVGSTQVFESHTVNISMTGLSLADPLPDWIPRRFSAYLLRNGQAIPFFGTQLSSGNSKRIRVTHVELKNLWRKWVLGGW